jgi:hypothetical protein
MSAPASCDKAEDDAVLPCLEWEEADEPILRSSVDVAEATAGGVDVPPPPPPLARTTAPDNSVSLSLLVSGCSCGW